MNRRLPLLVCLLACGCPERSNYVPVAEPVPAPTRAVLYGTGTPSLAPSGAGSIDTSAYLVNVYEGLVRFDEEMGLAPGLAESWESEDLQTYTFTLADGLRWSDGATLTAEDVVRSFQLFLREAEDWAWVLTPIEGAPAYAAGEAEELTGVEVVDARTLKVRLGEPDGLFLHLLALAPAGIYKRDGEGLPVGAGPWTPHSQSGRTIALTPNAHYHGPSPALATLVFQSGGVTPSQFRDGAAHVLDVSGEGGELRDADLALPSGAEIRRYPGLNTHYAAFAPSVPREVRALVNRAFDRARYCAKELQGWATPAKGVLPPGMPGYREELPELSAEGLEALAEPVTLRVWLDAPLFEALARDLKPYGVRLTQPQEQPYDLVQQAWIADYPDPDNFLRVLLHSTSGGSLNYARYANPELDELVERARRLSADLEQGARMELYQQAEDLVRKDMPWLFLWHYENAIAIAPGLKGVRTCPLDMGGFLELSQTDLRWE